jgi:hypothetical protein
MRNEIGIAWFLAVTAVGAPAVESDLAKSVKVAVPEASKPVTAAVAVVPQNDRKTAMLVVKVRIFALHHIYGLDKSGSENTPTTLKVDLPKGIAFKGAWQVPDPKKGKGKSRIYEEEVVFRRQFMIDRSVAPGRYPIKCELAYQVCDEELCWPPATIPLSTDIEVLPSK